MSTMMNTTNKTSMRNYFKVIQKNNLYRYKILILSKDPNLSSFPAKSTNTK